MPLERIVRFQINGLTFGLAFYANTKRLFDGLRGSYCRTNKISNKQIKATLKKKNTTTIKLTGELDEEDCGGNPAGRFRYRGELSPGNRRCAQPGTAGTSMLIST